MWETSEERSGFLSSASVTQSPPQAWQCLVLPSSDMVLPWQGAAVVTGSRRSSNKCSLPDGSSHVSCSCSAHFSALSLEHVVHQPIHHFSDVLKHSRGSSWTKVQSFSGVNWEQTGSKALQPCLTDAVIYIIICISAFKLSQLNQTQQPANFRLFRLSKRLVTTQKQRQIFVRNMGKSIQEIITNEKLLFSYFRLSF